MTSRRPRAVAGTPGTTAIGVVGGDELGRRWRQSLLGIEGIRIEHFSTSSGEDLATAFTERSLQAIVLASPESNVLALAKRALVSRCHVMMAGYGAVDSKHVLELQELARGRRLSLLFDTGGFADEGIEFARRMTRGDEPIWRRRYLRALRCETSEVSLDAVGLDAMSRLLALCDGLPVKVSALATRFDAESGIDGAATVALGFEGDFLARLDVSLMEAERRDEITMACEGRTALVERANGHSAVQIATSASRDARHALTIEVVSPGGADRLQEAAAEFVATVRKRTHASNTRDIAGAALVWETARASMARGGDSLPLPSNHPLIATSRPSLQVIEGGGHTTETAAPRLRVLQGGRRREQSSSPPPRSA